jgi:hypothetical protein
MKIFLSSTYVDLVEYRAAAANALERLGQQGIRMEVFGARPTDATSACFDEIGESDAFSDMERNGVQDEGIRFLNNLRRRSSAPPVIFSIGRLDPTLGTPPFAFGITSRVDECLNLLLDALERARG